MVPRGGRLTRRERSENTQHYMNTAKPRLSTADKVSTCEKLHCGRVCVVDTCDFVCRWVSVSVWLILLLDIKTDKMVTEPMEICIGLGLGPLKPLPSIIIKPNSIGTRISLGQCTHAVSPCLCNNLYCVHLMCTIPSFYYPHYSQFCTLAIIFLLMIET